MRLGSNLLHIGPGKKESMSLILNTHFRYLDAAVNKVLQHTPESWPSQLTRWHKIMFDNLYNA